jgi:hypothetical protein
MKPHRKKKALTFGELIASVCDACGCQKAAGILRLAVDARLVEFRGLQRFVISPRRTTNQFPDL